MAIASKRGGIGGGWKQLLPEVPATRFSCITSGSFRPKLGLCILCVVLIIALCLVLVPSLTESSPSPVKMASTEMVHEASVKAIAKSNGDFTQKLYNLLVSAQGKDENMVASPFSISAVMAMAFAGAKGDTADQMKSVLAFPEESALQEGYEDLFRVLKSNENFTLESANRVFVHENYKFLDAYLTTVKKHYHAEPQGLNFEETEKSREVINKWVEGQTKEKIKDLLPSGSIKPLTRMVLVNAVYFKGDWKKKFDKANTKKEPFTTHKNEKLDVDMMHQTSEFRGAQSKELGCLILELPYKGDRLSMLVFLSRKPEDFDAMEEKFGSFDYSNLKLSGAIKFDLSFPKFKLESKHDLVENLKKIGLDDMFVAGKADFSGMDGTRNLYASSVVQKAFIEVNEEGSEAAAATGMVMMMRSMPAPPQKFTCDRPFLFAIKDNLTGMVLFTGRVTDPSK